MHTPEGVTLNCSRLCVTSIIFCMDTWGLAFGDKISSPSLRCEAVEEETAT